MPEIATEEATSLVIQAKSIAKIADPDQYTNAAALRNHIKTAIKYFTDLYEPRLAEQRQHLNNLRADRDRFIDPLTEATGHLGGLLVAYDQEQERIKKRRELEEEAENKRKAEEEKKQLLELAKQVGDKDLVKEIKNQPLDVQQSVVTKDTPKVEGLSYREDWYFEVTEPNKVPREYLLVDAVKIGKIVRAMKQGTNIPGVRVFSKKIPIQRGQ